MVLSPSLLSDHVTSSSQAGVVPSERSCRSDLIGCWHAAALLALYGVLLLEITIQTGHISVIQTTNLILDQFINIHALPLYYASVWHLCIYLWCLSCTFLIISRLKKNNSSNFVPERARRLPQLRFTAVRRGSLKLTGLAKSSVTYRKNMIHNLVCVYFLSISNLEGCR